MFYHAFYLRLNDHHCLVQYLCSQLVDLYLQKCSGVQEDISITVVETSTQVEIIVVIPTILTR